MTTKTQLRHPELAEIPVADAMHAGVLTCPIETPLRTVAQMLTTYNVHCVIVFGSEEEHENGVPRAWGVVSDLDLVGAALAGDVDERTAGGAAASPVIFVSGSATLDRAAQLMTEHETAHLVVVDPDTLQPVGVLSTLDVAAALSGLTVHSGPRRVVRHT